jgi:alpha-tubulin suppressor-like RCC1 family protein
MLFHARRGALAAQLSMFVGMALASGCGSRQEGEAVVEISAQGLAEEDVTRVTVRVSGPGIAPDIVSDLVQTAGRWGGIIGRIPAGSDRTFTAWAHDASGTQLYRGQATGLAIIPGETAVVVILLQQSAPPDPFTNTAPRIVAVSSSARQVQPFQPVTVTVTAEDPDGDPLAYAWTASGGSLAGADSARAIWTAPAAEGAYTLEVSVTDGRGGQAGFSLVFSVVSPWGDAEVSISFNTWPVVTLVSAAPGQVDPGQSSALDVAAVDPDGDALAYSWNDSCGGSFSDRRVKSPTWTAPATAPAGSDCTVRVRVRDGRGGRTTGSLVIRVGRPTVPTAPPVIDQTFQSTRLVGLGGVVTLRVAAHDPEGTALRFTWTASGGTLAPPVTSPSQSEVTWTAPAAGGLFTITAVVRDTPGDETTQDFTVVVATMEALARLDGGGYHTVALKRDGTLWGTGYNADGELGGGTNTDRSTFIQVLTGVTDVAAGDFHTLALKADGTLWATGGNFYGQLGDGTNTDRSSYVQVLTGVSSIAAGYAHSLALKADGTLWATGLNLSGELGDGTTTNRSTFVQVLTGVSSIAAGGEHSLALKADGTLWTAGNNSYGQLGDGTITSRSTFVQVLTGVTHIAAGNVQSLALKADGTLWGAGSNHIGEIGDGSTLFRTSFVQVLAGVSSIAAGGSFSLALKGDGTLWATGHNFYGQLGDGTTTNRRTFGQVWTSVSLVGAGGFHTLVQRTDGTLWAAGFNQYGQLGDGTDMNRPRFVPVAVP